MNYSRYLPCVGALFSVSIAQADWMLIDDFEAGASDPKFTYTVQYGDRSSPEFVYGEDPTDSTNTVFVIDPKTYGTEWTNTYANWVLPTPIPEGGKGTLYCRFYKLAEDSLPMIFGLSDIPVAFDETSGEPTAPLGFSSWEAQVRIFPDLAPNDAGTYQSTGAGATSLVWYHLWMVVDNEMEETTFYLQGPDDLGPVHVPVPDGLGGFYETAIFRNTSTTDPLVGVMYGCNASYPTDPYSGTLQWIDDIYVDPVKENLTIPGETWAGMPVTADKHVNTGEFMGWLNVAHKPWLWSWELHNWVYLPEPDPGFSGAWGYVVNPQ